MEEIIHISSIAEVYEFLNAVKPAHPLITVIRKWPKVGLDLNQLRFTSDLYYLAMKRDISGSFQYGRSVYDYQEASMVFIGPGQVASFSNSKAESESEGWTILFHPDLIRKSELGKTIRQYSFFSYDTNEALHLSEKERKFLNTLVDTIEQEISQNLDRHSQALIVQNLETILKYSNRFYDRQFYTRTNLNRDLLSKFENFLQSYFASDQPLEKGLPTIDDCGKALNMSGAYLSDLLRAETGRSAKDHIHSYLIDHAKTALLNSTDSVSQIAVGLGFEYPQNFSKLFKAKTGMSPSEYRNLD
ncbi:MAG: helix-turn-helix domain-containing protein [Calothrix sp. MO_167.B12]|nr:helix-turn-helix domain-containing protein [Calothrix sp. MO_167.B12]